MLKEFKEFALRGNVIDMAVGIIIGGAFGKIITSIVNDLIMPIFGHFLAGMDFTNLKIVLSKAQFNGAGEIVKPEAAILYGNFIQVTIDFLLIALSIFIVIRIMNRMRRQTVEEDTKTEEIAPTETELLTEIRDLLKNK